MKLLLIPDSFKGTLSSIQIVETMKEVAARILPEADIVGLPVADGGEGSVDAFLYAAKGEKHFVTVQDPFGKPMEAFFGLMDQGRTAVIEMAACAGLPLAEGRLAPDKTTTFGVGELMRAALDAGAKKLLLCLGGSATNDMGCGMLAALGIRFVGRDGKEFVPTGGTLSDIQDIRLDGLDPRLKDTQLIALCDVTNPLYGENGAAYVFAPQKGADAAMTVFLDQQLRAGAETAARVLGKDLALLPGAGAAGGLGFGAAAFLHAKLTPGIDAVLAALRFDEQLRDADLVLTGEGRLDSQSLAGKVVAGVARAAKPQNVPVIAIVGDILDPIAPIYDAGVTAVLSTNRMALPWEKAKPRAKTDLALTCETALRLYKAFYRV